MRSHRFKPVRKFGSRDQRVAEMFIGGLLSFIMPLVVCELLGLKEGASFFIAIMVTICWITVRGEID